MTGGAFADAYRFNCFSPFKDNYRLKMGQRIPAGFTMSSFLDKLELLESALATHYSNQPVKAVDMAIFLLRSFYHNDYVWKGPGIEDAENSAKQKNIVRNQLESVLANLPRPGVKPADFLQLDDLCFLMFSLAHNVNKTLTYRDYGTYSADENQQTLEKKPREEGVVSVTGNKESAVAIGRTIFGIAAVHQSLHEKEIKDVVGSAGDDIPSAIATQTLKPVATATVGVVIGGPAIINSKPQVQENFLLGGQWKDDGCHLEYMLERDTNTSSTLAEVTGAVDGYILGESLKKVEQLQQWNLSTILRMYYSPQGIQAGERTLSFCRRGDLFKSLDITKITQQIKNLGLALAYSGALTLESPSDSKEAQVARRVDSIMSQFQNKYGDLTKDSSTPLCYTGTKEFEPECETPTDLYVVLDSSQETVNDDNTAKLQSEILGAVMRSMKLQAGVSTVTVFASKKEGSDMLKKVVASNSAAGCPGCASLYLRDLDTNAVGSDSDSDVFTVLNGFMNKEDSFRDVSRPNKDSSSETSNGHASKVILYLNLRNKEGSSVPQGRRSQVADALSRFRVEHPDVPIFAVGYKQALDALNQNSGALSVIDITNLATQGPDNFDNIKEDPEIKKLVKRICNVPAGLGYRQCMSKDSKMRSEKDAIFEGYVTPRMVQYWSYTPKTFSASKNLQIKFTSTDSGYVKVCDLTGRVIDGNLANLRCYDTSAQMPSVSFNYTRPCKKGPESCSPITYAVVGKFENQPTNLDASSCEGFCRNPQQVKFQITHDGMYCAGVLSAMFSPFTLLLTVIALLRNWFSS